MHCALRHQFYLHRARRQIRFPSDVSRLIQPITKPYNYKRAVGVEVSIAIQRGIVVRFPKRNVATRQQTMENIDVRISLRHEFVRTKIALSNCHIYDLPTQTASASNERSSDKIISFLR